ncbi:hypothetical protein [Vibrio splendidus]|uniref:hypothetical protein n=1 Tax=Vibrio splendidus TaxID=29497 RepID=UPI0011B469D9|nr:hypothetical protein [Vibrio splendidus]
MRNYTPLLYRVLLIFSLFGSSAGIPVSAQEASSQSSYSVVEQYSTSDEREFQKFKRDKSYSDAQSFARLNKEQQDEIISLTRDLDTLKEQLQSNKEGMGFEVWLGLTLASVTLIVTGLGVIIAILAFFGYSNIKEAATAAAVKKSELLVLNAIKDGQFNRVIYSAVERAVYRDILSENDFPEEEEQRV